MDFVMQNGLWVALAVISGTVLLWPGLGLGGAKKISPQQAVLLCNRERAVLIDVRESSEHSTGMVPQAQTIPLSTLSNRIKEIENKKSRPIITMCASGLRAGRACSILRRQGFEQIYVMDGGLRAWKEAGFPLKGV